MIPGKQDTYFTVHELVRMAGQNDWPFVTFFMTSER